MKPIFRPLLSVAILLVLPTLSGAVTHTVNQVGLTFEPSEITINAGDTVRWVLSSGNHTVTSGVDTSDPAVGALFDEPFDAAHPTVSFTFTEVGDQNYFCRPHLSFGMTGIVHVLAPSAAGDAPERALMQLLPNAPNPFNPSTRITFRLPGSREGPLDVRLRVFDLQGRLVRVLLDEVVSADQRSVLWDGRNSQGRVVASGVYLYRLTAGGDTLSRSMTLTK